MRVLALDTATEACSVALLSGDECISRSAEGGRSHAQQVLEMVEAVLAEAEGSLSMLDGIAASIGPGAFTGVRISVAVAQGLAFGAGLRVVPVSTLEALALQAVQSGGRPALIASCPASVGPPESVVLPAPGAYRGIGRGFGAYPALAALPGLKLDPKDTTALPNAREFARLGALRLRRGEGMDPADLSPLYLRDKVALTEAERRQQKA